MSNTNYHLFCQDANKALIEAIGLMKKPAISKNKVNPKYTGKDLRAKLSILAREPCVCNGAGHNLQVGRSELVVIIHGHFKSEDYLDGLDFRRNGSYRFVFGENLRENDFPEFYQHMFDMHQPSITRSLKVGNYFCAVGNIAQVSDEVVKLYRSL